MNPRARSAAPPAPSSRKARNLLRCASADALRAPGAVLTDTARTVAATPRQTECGRRDSLAVARVRSTVQPGMRRRARWSKATEQALINERIAQAGDPALANDFHVVRCQPRGPRSVS